jgi:hypothetical protein
MIPEATWRFLWKTRGAMYAIGYRAVVFASALGRLALLAVLSRIRHRSVVSNDDPKTRWLAALRWSIRRDRLVSQYYTDKGQAHCGQ